MKGSRVIEFELSGPTLELPVEWEYYYDRGKYSGRPEDCYPEEEDSSVYPPGNLEQVITDLAREQVKVWIKEIEGYCDTMQDNGDVSDWAREDSSEY